MFIPNETRYCVIIPSWRSTREYLVNPTSAHRFDQRDCADTNRFNSTYRRMKHTGIRLQLHRCLQHGESLEIWSVLRLNSGVSAFPRDLAFPSHKLLRTKAKSESVRLLIELRACDTSSYTEDFVPVLRGTRWFVFRDERGGGWIISFETRTETARTRIADKRNAQVSISISMLIPLYVPWKR